MLRKKEKKILGLPLKLPQANLHPRNISRNYIFPNGASSRMSITAASNRLQAAHLHQIHLPISDRFPFKKRHFHFRCPAHSSCSILHPPSSSALLNPSPEKPPCTTRRSAGTCRHCASHEGSRPHRPPRRPCRQLRGLVWVMHTKPAS